MSEISDDIVNHPKHYNQYKTFEVIEITEQLNYLRGNAVKYLLRANYKKSTIHDLEKAVWYIKREINNLKK